MPSFRRYPKEDSAIFSSLASMFPELSLSKPRKQFCKSVTYFHKAPKSSKPMVPRFWRSNIPTINRHVSGLNGAQVPLDRADCSSWEDMEPLLSLSTLIKKKKRTNVIHKNINTEPARCTFVHYQHETICKVGTIRTFETPSRGIHESRELPPHLVLGKT